MNVRIFWSRAMECMRAQTRPRFILSSERVFGDWSQNPCLLQGENPLRREKNLPRRGSNPRRCIKQDSEPITLPTSYYGPQTVHSTLPQVCIGADRVIWVALALSFGVAVFAVVSPRPRPGPCSRQLFGGPRSPVTG